MEHCVTQLMELKQYNNNITMSSLLVVINNIIEATTDVS